MSVLPPFYVLLEYCQKILPLHAETDIGSKKDYRV